MSPPASLPVGWHFPVTYTGTYLGDDEMVIRIHEFDKEMLEILDLGRPNKYSKSTSVLWAVVHRDFVDGNIYEYLEENGESEIEIFIGGVKQT